MPYIKLEKAGSNRLERRNKYMQAIPYEKMVCDSDYGDGGVYFYDEFFDWINRDSGKGFRIHYKDIKDTQVIMSQKRKVIITLNDGSSKNLYLYKYENLLKIIYEAIDRVNGKKEEPGDTNKEDDLSNLERLAKLHESGALTDEEFVKAKQKILG